MLAPPPRPIKRENRIYSVMLVKWQKCININVFSKMMSDGLKWPPPPLPAWACLGLWPLLQVIYIATLTYINSVYIFILRLLYIYKSGTYIVCNYIYVWVERWLIQEQLMFVRAAILRTHIQPSKTFVFWNHFFLYITIFYANLFSS